MVKQRKPIIVGALFKNRKRLIETAEIMVVVADDRENTRDIDGITPGFDLSRKLTVACDAGMQNIAE